MEAEVACTLILALLRRIDRCHDRWLWDKRVGGRGMRWVARTLIWLGAKRLTRRADGLPRHQSYWQPRW